MENYLTYDNSILVRDPENGSIYFKYIRDLTDTWTVENDHEYGTTGYQCYSLQGWCDILKVFRKKIPKIICKVHSDIGYVKIVDNTQLCSSSNIKRISVGYNLSSRYPTLFNDFNNGIDINHSYMAGVMLGEGEYIEVPFDVINGLSEVAEAFIEGYNSVDLKHKKVNNITLSQLYYLYRKSGLGVKVAMTPDGCIYLVQSGKTLSNVILSLEHDKYDIGYVYGIDSVSGSYQVGIGGIFARSCKY